MESNPGPAGLYRNASTTAYQGVYKAAILFFSNMSPVTLRGRFTPRERAIYIPVVQKAGWFPRTDREMVAMRKMCTSAGNKNPGYPVHNLVTKFNIVVLSVDT